MNPNSSSVKGNPLTFKPNKPVMNVGGSNSVVTPVRRDRLRLVLLAICAAMRALLRRVEVLVQGVDALDQPRGRRPDRVGMIDGRSRFEALEDRAHAGELPMKPRRRAPNRTQLFSFVVHFLVEHALLDIVQRSDNPGR